MDGISAASTGLNVTAQSLLLTANNVANVQSDGFQSASLKQRELPQGGVAPDGIARSQEPPSPGGSNVDLATQATDLLLQGQNYGADLKFMKVEQKVLGTALDLNA